jgi:flotillin
VPTNSILILLAGGSAAIVLVLGLWIRSRWTVARPNEWLLVIHKGKMVKAGVGLATFRGWGQQVVRFPSSIQRLQFKAQQVTKEMQGIEVSGFVNWVVYREDQGPWKAYQNLEDLESGESQQANDNIARLAESIIRHRVANSTIQEVITNREELRNKIRQSMQEVVKGWGVWLETVEITDVVILSTSLFEDLQTPFRQETRKQAEAIRMNTAREIEQQKIAQETELAQQRADADAYRAIYQAQKRLEQEQEEEKLFEEQQRISRARLEQEQELERLRLAGELKNSQLRADHERELLRERLAVEATMTSTNVEMAILDKAESIYKALPLEQVKLINMGPHQGLESLLTNLVMALRSASEELGK